jgi:GntR family transcriptional regulator
VADALRARIRAGEFPVDGKLPSIDALHAEYRVAPATIDRALEVLRKEGIAETVHGSGTYVRDPGEPERPAEYGELEQRVAAVEADLMDLRAKLGYEQHQQDSGRRDEHAG